MKSVQLLNEKNHFLEKFYSLNENQLIQLSEGHFENIESFYNQREDILKIIKYIDSQIERCEQDDLAMQSHITDQDREAVKKQLKVKTMFITQIIEQDVQIISLIDRLKTDVIKELRTVRENKKAMAGYRSSLA